MAWDEPVTALGGVNNIFASRFASQAAPAQNGGQWVPEGQARGSGVPSLNINTDREAINPSLIGGTTIAGGNPAPWITWQEADNGTQSVPTGSPGTDVRTPIASTCPDDPFTGDGSTCPGGSIGTPFFSYTDNAAGPQELFAQGYTPGTTTTAAASAVTKTTASVAGTVDTDGAPTRVQFDFGTSTAYGSTTAAQLLPPTSGVSTPVSASLGSLPAGS